MFEELNESQRDALTETINIGVGRASRALAQLTRSEVAISVPVIIQAEPGDIANIVAPSLFNSPDVCSVARRVIGLDADLAMVFQANKEAMANLIMSGIVRDGQTEPSDVRQEVSNKIGNLMIESCLDQMEHVVGRNIERFKLAYHPKLPADIFGLGHAPKEAVIIVKIDIAIINRNISGHLLCALTHKAANRLADGLDALVAEENES